ncbi:MAG TPA: tetratricopeptide repeat protein [Terriglobales bacterium]|nr:tetratricopeptide repeat protein [Terriglobales bacterium]
MKRFCLVLALVSLALPLLADEGHHHDLTSAQLGAVSFPTSCSPKVQKQFEQGVAWLHSFEYQQAEKTFEAVTERDPKCAMGFWGRAMSLYHQLWARPNAGETKRGAALLREAQALKPRTQRERDYIAALQLFFASADEAGYTARVEQYSAAMEKLRQANPQDREAAVFYALSLLARDDGDDPSLKLRREAVAILNQQLPGASAHPGITHYLIHATDNPELAPQGLAAARAYAKIAPTSPHAVHMPSHIFSRLGLWHDSVQSNTAALAAAEKMHGFHMAHHKVHSMEFLEYAYLQLGDDRNARAMLDAMMSMKKEDVDPAYYDYYYDRRVTFPATFYLERHDWKQALALRADAGAPPFVAAKAHWANAIAAGHLKDAATAKSAVDQLQAAIAATSAGDKAYFARYLDDGRNEALAWLRYAEGNHAEAITLLRSVAEKQDKVGKGEVEIPAREMLADLLLELGRAPEALAEYQTAMKTDPGRFDSLYGAAQAAAAAGKQELAAQYYAQLVKNCSGSDSDRPELARAKAAANAGD